MILVTQTYLNRTQSHVDVLDMFVRLIKKIQNSGHLFNFPFYRKEVYNS